MPDWPAELECREVDAADGAVVIDLPRPQVGSRPKFDPFAAWERLSPERQRQFGAAAVVLAYAGLVSPEVDGVSGIGFEAACAAIDHVIAAALPPLALRPGQKVPLPDLAGFGVVACRVCGCTDAVGCWLDANETCHWVEPDLCSACAERLATGIRPW